MASKSDKSTRSEFALDGALGGSWEGKKKEHVKQVKRMSHPGHAAVVAPRGPFGED